MSSIPENYYKFDLVPLPYSYDALEPYIDTETMQVHHDGHLQTYVDNLNAILANYPALQNKSLEELLSNTSVLPADAKTGIINNGGGVYNHNFFFQTLRPGRENNRPTGALAESIDRQFGSFENFKDAFTKQALAVFGSGYVYLVRNRAGNLMLFATANQETPISYGFCPIINLDVWEHAYYLKHQNKRKDYIADWWSVANWTAAEKNYQKCLVR